VAYKKGKTYLNEIYLKSACPVVTTSFFFSGNSYNTNPPTTAKQVVTVTFIFIAKKFCSFHVPQVSGLIPIPVNE